LFSAFRFLASLQIMPCRLANTHSESELDVKAYLLVGSIPIPQRRIQKAKTETARRAPAGSLDVTIPPALRFSPVLPRLRFDTVKRFLTLAKANQDATGFHSKHPSAFGGRELSHRALPLRF